MKHVQEESLQEIIKSLQRMHQVKPDAAFRIRMEKKVHDMSSFRLSPFVMFRVALFAVLILIIGGTSVVATENSQPGTLLYPVKKLVESVKTSFPTTKMITATPPQEQLPTQIPTASPTATPQKESSKKTPSSHVDSKLEQPTTTPTPLPTTKPRDVLPAAVKPVTNVVQNTSVKVDLPIIGSVEIKRPTPTPPPGGSNHEGSKDSGSNAGAGGSLLPKIKIGL